MQRRLDGLRLIGLFKIGRALLLLLTTYGVYRLLNPALIDRLHEWVYSLTDNVERRMLERALDWVSSLSHAHISGIVVVTAAYTVVLLTEGIGLWFRQRWAEWLTAIASTTLIPFELYKVFDPTSHHRIAVLCTLAINIAIVAYLFAYLRRTHATGARPT